MKLKSIVSLLTVFLITCVSLQAQAPKYNVTRLRNPGQNMNLGNFNNLGEVVGSYFDLSCGCYRAFLYSNGTITTLGTLGGANSYAYDINDKGQIVGTSTSLSGPLHAFLYSNETMEDLGVKVCPDGLGYPSVASGINSVGQAIGWCVVVYGVTHTTGSFLYNSKYGNYSFMEADKGGINGINDAGWLIGANEYYPFLLVDGVEYNLMDLIYLQSFMLPAFRL